MEPLHRLHPAQPAPLSPACPVRMPGQFSGERCSHSSFPQISRAPGPAAKQFMGHGPKWPKRREESAMPLRNTSASSCRPGVVDRCHRSAEQPCHLTLELASFFPLRAADSTQYSRHLKPVSVAKSGKTDGLSLFDIRVCRPFGRRRSVCVKAFNLFAIPGLLVPVFVMGARLFPENVACRGAKVRR